jgi:DNA polymerase-1
MAHSRRPGLLRAFAQGEDVHRATAAEVFGVPPIEVDEPSSGATPRSSTSA